MSVPKQSVPSEPHYVTEESIQAFLQAEEKKKISPDTLYHWKGYILALFRWLPEDKLVTKEVLAEWRKDFEEKGYSYHTISNYAKTINRYLRFVGREDLCFTRGKAKDLTGQRFGLLTAIEPTEKRHHSYIVWRCVCDCGNEVEVPSSQLLLHHVLSCGCLGMQYIQRANRYIDGTGLRQALEEKVVSDRAVSGYVGVMPSKHGGDKWEAYIQYKGEKIHLGTHDKLADAVKARARAKELVQEDAMKLAEVYEELHKDDAELPNRKNLPPVKKAKKKVIQKNPVPAVVRSNNTSGYTGVFFQDNRWNARITYKKVTYRLGSYIKIEDAVAARRKAETLLKANPEKFIEKYSASCSKYKNG